VDFSDSAIADQFAGIAEIPLGALLTSGQPDHTISSYCITNGPTFGYIVGERLLAVNILAGPGGHYGWNCVPVVGSGNGHRVDITAGDDFAKVIASGAILVAIFFVYYVTGIVAKAGIDIANCNNVNLLLLQEGPHITCAFAAHADAAHYDAATRRY